MRCMQRLFRRAAVPLKMSQGFHPKPRMTFPSALAVGIEGTDEVMELELAEPRTADGLLLRLAEKAPPGLAIKSVEVLPPGAPKARACGASYQVPIPPQFREGLSQRIDRLLAADSCPIRRPDRTSPVDLRPSLEALTLREGVLRLRLQIDVQGGVRPRDVLRALGLAELETSGVHLTRTAVEVR